MISGEGGVVEHDAVFAVEAFFYRVERFVHQALFQSDARHRAPALTFDEDFSFLVLVATNLVAEEVVCTQEPLTVPSILLYSFGHGISRFLHSLGLVFLADFLAECYIVLGGDNEEAGNHQRLSLRTFALVLCGLETLVRIPREAVQIEAVVPVGTADERQPVRTKILDNVIERHAQMLEERYLCSWLVVEGHHLIEDGEVARLLDVGNCAEDEPARVVVETTANVVVAAFRERLVLVIASAVGELCRSNVDDALAGTFGNLMDKAHEVLVGVAEAHAASDPTLEERCRAAHAECHHALVLVPDIHHAVEFRVARLHLIDVEQTVPVFA